MSGTAAKSPRTDFLQKHVHRICAANLGVDNMILVLKLGPFIIPQLTSTSLLGPNDDIINKQQVLLADNAWDHVQ